MGVNPLIETVFVFLEIGGGFLNKYKILSTGVPREPPPRGVEFFFHFSDEASSKKYPTIRGVFSVFN